MYDVYGNRAIIIVIKAIIQILMKYNSNVVEDVMALVEEVVCVCRFQC